MRLADYSKYSARNWDGYNADPVPARAIRHAEPLIAKLESAGVRVHDAPGADGTVGLEFDIDGVSYVVDFGEYRISGRAKA